MYMMVLFQQLKIQKLDFKTYIEEVNNIDPNWMYVDKIKWVIDEDINSETYGQMIRNDLASVSSIFDISC